MRKLQSQGVHHITICGADPQTSLDFEPPLPVSVDLAPGTDADPQLEASIHDELRRALIVQTRIEFVPFGTVQRSEYKATLVERT